MKRKIAMTIVFTILFSITLTGLNVNATATDAAPRLDKPENFTVELKENSQGLPYFIFKCDVPKSVVDINKIIIEDGVYNDTIVLDTLELTIDYKINDGPWNEGLNVWNTDFTLEDIASNNVILEPADEGGFEEIDIKASKYTFRAYFKYIWGYIDDWMDKEVRSDFSTTVTIGVGSYYQGASKWATEELDKAASYGLITDSIKDDMKAPITREEFAELATRLYEVYTGKKAEAAATSTFTDTTNIEILKASNLGIVNGVGNNKFDPKALTNREQIAAMLNRAVKVINPTTDMSIMGAPAFTDESEIASYFIDNVKFMAKKGLINGVGDNRFAPKATCTREQAVLIAVRVYEAYHTIAD